MWWICWKRGELLRGEGEGVESRRVVVRDGLVVVALFVVEFALRGLELD